MQSFVCQISLPSLQADMEQYWPSGLISEKARNTTGLVWPLQVSGVCLRLLMVTGGQKMLGERRGETDTGQGPLDISKCPLVD